MAKKINVEETALDLTSMIDVCFLLIAFFIMVSEISKSEIVEVYLPFANYAQEDNSPPDDRLILNIDRTGQVWMRTVNYGKPNILANRDRIDVILRGLATSSGFEDPNDKNSPSNLTVLIRADAHAPFRFVQCVMLLLTKPDTRVMKVHYSAKNPFKKA
ncbi:MAG: biopolymer transporter ExbD [Planctomycetes bacterium]|nr:biopolymer transporter ExbD [Planctomycetota bacterium]